MNAHGHHKVVCRECSEVILQCRCFSKDKRVQYSTCKACLAKPVTAAPSPDGPHIASAPNADAGDSTQFCSHCGEERDEPHSWKQCAAGLLKERNRAIDELADMLVSGGEQINRARAREAEACAACCLVGTIDEVHQRILDRAGWFRAAL